MPIGAWITLAGLVVAFIVHAVLVGYGRGRQDEKIEQQGKQRIEDRLDFAVRLGEQKAEFERRIVEARNEARERDSSVGDTSARELRHFDDKIDALGEGLGNTLEQIKGLITSLSARVGSHAERMSALEAQAKKSDPRFVAVKPRIPRTDENDSERPPERESRHGR